MRDRARTLHDVARRLGLSVERVRQIECAALAKLRPVCEALDLHPGDIVHPESALERAAALGDEHEDEAQVASRRDRRRAYQRSHRAQKRRTA